MPSTPAIIANMAHEAPRGLCFALTFLTIHLALVSGAQAHPHIGCCGARQEPRCLVHLAPRAPRSLVRIRDRLSLNTSCSPAGSCPARPGYNSLMDMIWVADGRSNPLRTSPPVNAEKICSLDRNCVAWNDKGFYFLGTIGSYRPQARTCSYVKVSVAKQGKQQQRSQNPGSWPLLSRTACSIAAGFLLLLEDKEPSDLAVLTLERLGSSKAASHSACRAIE